MNIDARREVAVDIGALTKEEREALARDRTTDPAVLTELASDFYLLTTLVANPSTPEETLRGIYRDFPHLRPADTGPLGAAPGDDVEAAIASFRRRQASTAQSHAPSAPGHPTRQGVPMSQTDDTLDPTPDAQTQSAVGAPPSRPSASDVVGYGISMVAKLMVTGLWFIFIVLGFTVGAPWFGVLGIAYLAYLWLFGGRWLIY